MTLGIQQLKTLRPLSTRLVMVVGNARTARLCQLGLCESLPDGHMVRITAAGLRAVADAADAGRLPVFDDSLEEMIAKMRPRSRRTTKPPATGGR